MDKMTRFQLKTLILILVLVFGVGVVLLVSLEATGSGQTKTQNRKTFHRASVDPRRDPARRMLHVTATAYNSVRWETSSTPNYGAWGDRLRPGMKAIAVSRDLLGLGLTHGVRVKISGLPGTYRVLDKMASRWHRRIDIYMGRDVKAARRWGKRRVRIWWSPRRRS